MGNGSRLAFVSWRPRAELTSFVIATVAAFAFALLASHTNRFYYDSAMYWENSKGFVKDGHWSLLNFADMYHGYVAGLTFGGVRSAADHLGVDAPLAIKAFIAPLFALIGTVLLPRLATLAWPSVSLGVIRRLIMTTVLVLFWSGYLSYPLTDFLGLAAGLVALLLVARRWSVPALVGSGIAAGLAINLRPAYLVFGVGMLVLAGWREPDAIGRGLARRGLAVGLVLLGIIAVSAPQALITHRNYGLWSPIPGAAAHLGAFQLTTGLRVQLYSTYVGNNLGTPRMIYADPSGAKLIKSLKLNEKTGLIDGNGDYLALIAKHPLAMAGVLSRHLVNGLDQRYASPYPAVLDSGQRRPWRLAGFLLLFFAILRVGWPAARRGLGMARWRYLVVLALASATSLPSAIEQRFLLPLFVITLLLAFAPGWPPLIGTRSEAVGWRRFAVPATIAVTCAVFMAIMWTVVSATSEHLTLAQTFYSSGRGIPT